MNSKKTGKAQYSPRKLEKCLNDVREGVYTVTQASRAFNIPRSSISCKLLKIRPDGKGKNGPEAVLGEETERKLVTWLLDHAERGFPLTKSCLLFSVKLLVEQCYDKKDLPFTDGMPGKKWYSSFLKRHPNVVEKRSEYLSASRAAVTEEGIRNWFQKVVGLLKDDVNVLNHPDRIYNVDESAFFLNSNGKVVLAERGQPVYDINQNSDKDSTTISVCVSATGELAPTLVVYKFVRLPAVYGSSLPSGWSVGTSESGWMNGEIFYEYFANVFVPFKKEKHGDETILIFFDGHRSPLTYQVSTLGIENNIIFICFSPNATHIMQPLDVSAFKTFKTLWRKERDLFEFQKNRNIFKYEIPKILNDVFQKYSFTKTFVNGFRKSGLYPWNPDAIDYSKKCNFKSKEPADVVNIPLPSLQSKTMLDLFESKIDDSVLREFRSTRENWQGDQKYMALFGVWRSLLQDDESYIGLPVEKTSDSPAIYNVLENVPNSQENWVINCMEVDSEDLPPEILWGDSTLTNGIQSENDLDGRELELPVIFAENSKRLNLSSNASGLSQLATSFPQKDDASIQQLVVDTPEKENSNNDAALNDVANISTNLNSKEKNDNSIQSDRVVASMSKNENFENFNDSRRISSNETSTDFCEPLATSSPQKDGAVTTSSPQKDDAVSPNNGSVMFENQTVDDILKSLTRGDFIKKTGKQKKSAANRVPVITSSLWRSIEEAKIKEKELEKKKAEDRLRKIANKLAKEDMKKKRKKKSENNEVTDGVVANENPIPIKRGRKKKCQNTVAPLSSIENITPPAKKKGRLNGVSKSASSLCDEIQIGSWVLVNYDDNEYPGLVTDIDTDDVEYEYEVKTLQKHSIKAPLCGNGLRKKT